MNHATDSRVYSVMRKGFLVLASALALVVGVVGYLFVQGKTLVWLTSARSFHSVNQSMRPTLRVGERWIAVMNQYHDALPRRGNVIVFRNPRKPEQDWVRRLIGLPGDQIQISRGRLLINEMEVERSPEGAEENDGASYRETLPNGNSHLIFEHTDDSAADQSDTYVFPERHVFVLGDNRDFSLDSRHAEVGMVPVDMIMGEAKVVYLSTDVKRILSPID